MRPFILPFIERRVRAMMATRGVPARKVETPAGPIHVYDAKGTGSLPTIVLVHGFSASGVGFVPIMMRLRAHAKRVLIPDLPGHGLSGDPSVNLTLDALFDATTAGLDELLGDDDYLLVGNSLGGLVSLAHAAKRPQSCRGIVLLSPAGAVSSRDEWDDLMSAFAMKTRREALHFTARVYHRVPFIARVLAHELPKNLQRRGVQDLLRSFTPDRAIPEGALAELKMPIFLAWGMSERLLPDSHLAWWKKHLPAQAVVERPEGWGHCPHMDQPDQVVDRIVSFFSRS